MKAYGVFDGGGIKGAALAGALAAAEDQGIKFTGFGGTSAGSMVAFLAAVGYSGKELGEALISQDLNDLLDDGGDVLREAFELRKKIAQFWDGSALQKIKALLAVKRLLAPSFFLEITGCMADRPSRRSAPRQDTRSPSGPSKGRTSGWLMAACRAISPVFSLQRSIEPTGSRLLLST